MSGPNIPMSFTDYPKPSITAVGGSGGDDQQILSIDPKNAEFVLFHATGEATLALLNPFMINKVIDGQAGAVESVRKLASGDLLVKIRSVNQVRDLLKLKKLHCYDVVQGSSLLPGYHEKE